MEGAGGAVQGGLDMWVWGSGARSGLEMGVQALSALKQSLRPQEAGGPRLGGEREREREREHGQPEGNGGRSWDRAPGHRDRRNADSPEQRVIKHACNTNTCMCTQHTNPHVPTLTPI